MSLAEFLILWFIVSVPAGIFIGLAMAGRLVMGREEALLILVVVLAAIAFNQWLGDDVDRLLAGLSTR